MGITDYNENNHIHDDVETTTVESRSVFYVELPDSITTDQIKKFLIGAMQEKSKNSQ